MRLPWHPHRCDFKPVAARPGYAGKERAFSGIFHETERDVRGTLILGRCKCGALQTMVLAGNWTAAELGVPTGDAEAIERLLREAKP